MSSTSPAKLSSTEPDDRRDEIQTPEGSGPAAGQAFKCPICNALTRRLFPRHGYWIRGCSECDHRITELSPSQDHVGRIYGSEYFTGGGSGYPNYLADCEILKAHGRRYARLVSRYVRPGIVLDIGAAAGFVLKGFTECGWSGVGLEPNAEMAGYGRKELALDIREGTLEDADLSGRFDLITMLQVVAHLTDLHKSFYKARHLTISSGFWLIETWDQGSLIARALGKYWHEYGPPSTLNYFTRESLKALARDYGFRQVATGRPRKKISGEHARSLLRYTTTGSGIGKLIPRTTSLIPRRASLSYPAFDLFWALFQRT